MTYIKTIVSIALALIVADAFAAPAQSWYAGKPIEVSLVASQSTTGPSCEINCTEFLVVKDIGNFFAVRGPDGGYAYIGTLPEGSLETAVAPLTRIDAPIAAAVEGVSNMQPSCVRNCAFTVFVEGRGTFFITVRPNGHIGHVSVLDGDREGKAVDSNDSISALGTTPTTCTSYPYTNCQTTSGGSTGNCAVCVYYVTFYYNAQGILYKIVINDHGKITTRLYNMEY